MTDIKLSAERKKTIQSELTAFYADTFDQELSDYQAQRLLQFFIQALGPSVYNQGVQDTRAFIADKLDHIEGDVYMSETEG